MTNEISYREKGRAVFLAALMVMSVVAMSAAFAGAAAANEHADQSLDATNLNGDDVWIGQQVEFSNLNDPADLMQGDEVIQNLRVGQDGTATVDTTELDEGRYYIEHDGTDTGSFWVNEQVIDTEFESTVAGQDDPVNVNYEDVSEVERSDGPISLNVTGELDGETLSGEELAGIFTEGEEVDDDVAQITDVTVDDDFEANFVDSEVGDYEFTFDVTDTTASDNASVTVTDDDADYEFVNVEEVDQGDFAEITIGVDQSSSASVVLYEEDVDFASGVEVTDIEGDEVVLLYNTHAPSDDEAWQVHDDSDAEVSTAYHGDVKIEDQALPVHNWDLSIGPADQLEEPVDLENFEDYDRDRLVVNDHAGFGDTVSSTAPADEDVTDFESFDEYATETDTIAEGDHLFLTLEDFGAEGAVEDVDTDDFVVEIVQDESTVLGEDDTTWNSSSESDDYVEFVELLDNDVEEYDGDLIFVVDLTALDGFEYEDSEHEVTFTVTDNSYYVSDDEEYEAELETSFEERNIEWDDIDSLPADSDATATGETNVAPGTELEADADSPSDEGGFVDYTDAVVADDYTFTAEFDLEGEQVGSLFTLTAEDTSVDSGIAADDAVLEEVVLESASDAEDGIELGANYDEEITTEESTDIDAVVTNNGDDTKTIDLELELDGEVYTDSIDVDGQNSETVTLTTADGADLGAGDFDFTINAETNPAHDSYDGTLTVTEAGDDDEDDDGSDDDGSDDDGSDDDGADDGADDDGSDDDGSDDDDSDDGTPGFGVAVAVVALLAAAMLALRRQN